MKNAKILLAIWSVVISLPIGILMSGCGGTSNSDVIRVVSERDSLRQVARLQQRRLQQVNDVMMTLGQALDSVQQQENLLFVNPSGEGAASRADALNNLNRFETILRSQQRHIDDLERKLREAEQEDVDIEPDRQAQTLIANLRQQLKQKDELIAQLRTQLEAKDVDITKLRAVVASQQTQISQLGEANKRYTDALTRSSDMANRGFVAIAPKKELEAAGIVRKGKIQTKDALDRSKFRQVDIRKFTEITFEAKKPKILTAAPQSTYSLTTDGNGKFTLHITNPADFWSISNFLVIQTR